MYFNKLPDRKSQPNQSARHQRLNDTIENERTGRWVWIMINWSKFTNPNSSWEIRPANNVLSI